MVYKIAPFLILLLLCYFSIQQPVFFDVDSCKTSKQSPINLDSELGECKSQRMMNLQMPNQKVLLETDLFGILRFKNINKQMNGQLQSNDRQVKAQMYGTNINFDLIGYDLAEIQLRIRSEHKYHDEYQDLELQMIFGQKTYFNGQVQQAAIVSVFMKVDDLLTDDFFSINGNNINLDLYKTNDINNHYFYNYQGSSTTPPCWTTEWFISKKIYYISKNQYEKIKSQHKYINRAIQKNDGTVVYGGSNCNSNFQEFFGFFILYIFVINTITKLI